MKKLISILLTTIAGYACTMHPSPAPHPDHAPATLSFMRVPCPSEDAVMNCYWDAHRMGNGKGHSFYVILIDKAVCIKYWNASYDRMHGYCSLI